MVRELLAFYFDMRSQNSQTLKDLSWIIHFSPTFKALKMADHFLPHSKTFKDHMHPAITYTLIIQQPAKACSHHILLYLHKSEREVGLGLSWSSWKLEPPVIDHSGERTVVHVHPGLMSIGLTCTTCTTSLVTFTVHHSETQSPHAMDLRWPMFLQWWELKL